MTLITSTNGLQIKQKKREQQDVPGAVVIGGDYQVWELSEAWAGEACQFVSSMTNGRSLATRATQVLPCELLTCGIRIRSWRYSWNWDAGYLEGWVLFPTRDELVAAFSVHRAALSEVFRVPTPDWNCIQWIWDKRNTYRLGKKIEHSDSRDVVP